MAESEAPPKDDAEDPSKTETGEARGTAGAAGEDEASAKSDPPDPPEPSPSDEAVERAESPAETASAEDARGPSWLPLAVAIAVPLLFFFVLPPLTKSGLWDPYELNVADLARRIALNLHGADSLALEGADNSLPHLNDLGRPQLPFTSIALGFKLFG